MFIKKISQLSVAVFAGIALGACGGGGGGGSSSSSTSSTPVSPTPSTIAFSVSHAIYQMNVNGYTLSATISGKVNGVSVSGNGNISIANGVGTTFEGQSVVGVTSSLNGTVTANGQSFSIGNTGMEYLDSNFNELAYLDYGDGSLTVPDQNITLPNTVHVGDSGSLGSDTIYSDINKTTVIDTDTITYSVVADTATSIMFVTTTKTYDTGHNLTGTDIERIRVTENGVGTWVSLQTIETNGDQLTFTVQ